MSDSPIQNEEHNGHETSVQPDVENLEYRPYCHDCEKFFEIGDANQ